MCKLYFRSRHITPDYTDVPDIVCQDYAVPNMQNFIPKLPSSNSNSKIKSTNLSQFKTLSTIMAPNSEKYFDSNDIDNIDRLRSYTLNNTSTGTINSSQTIPISSYKIANISEIMEFPRQSLVIVEKLGSGDFGELHLCETKGIKYVSIFFYKSFISN